MSLKKYILTYKTYIIYFFNPVVSILQYLYMNIEKKLELYICKEKTTS